MPVRLARVHTPKLHLRGGGGGDGGGGGEVMASMRLRLVFSFSFGNLLLLGCGAVCRTRFGGPFRILVA